MVCTVCGVYEGDPSCGACRVVSRIHGILRSGRSASDQKRLTEVLLVAAGELSDLIEARVPKGSAHHTKRREQRAQPPGKNQPRQRKLGRQTRRRTTVSTPILRTKKRRNPSKTKQLRLPRTRTTGEASTKAEERSGARGQLLVRL